MGDDYTRMFKTAQIKQIAENYNKLLRIYARKKIIYRGRPYVSF